MNSPCASVKPNPEVFQEGSVWRRVLEPKIFTAKLHLRDQFVQVRFEAGGIISH